MVPPRYAWITYGWFRETFWKQSPSNETSYQVFDQCNMQQLMSIVNQMITVHSDPRYDERDEGNPIIGNLVRSRITPGNVIAPASSNGFELRHGKIKQCTKHLVTTLYP